MPHPLFEGQVFQPPQHVDGFLQNLLQVIDILVILEGLKLHVVFRCLSRSARQREITVLLDTTVFLLMQPLLATFAIEAHCSLVFGLLNVCKKANNGRCEYLKRIELS